MLLELFIDEPAAEQYLEQIEKLTESLGPTIAATLKFEDPATCNLIIVGEDYALELNKSFRGKDYIPDCLSFPLDPQEDGEEAILGEVYICWQKVISQAEEFGHSWLRECAWLMTHGLLHILGYEHGEEPCPEMRKLEEEILEQLNLRR